MSASLMPDICRHTARKSTVSKNLKPPSISSICNNSTTHYQNYHHDNNSSQQTLFNTNIKLEKDISQQPFIILQDNETEQMIVGDNNQQANEEIIYDILEEIKNQIIQSSSNVYLTTTNQINRTISIDTQDAHNTINSIINHINENDKQESLSSKIDEKIEENLTKSSDEITPMESDQPISRSQIDDDIVEIPESLTNSSSVSSSPPPSSSSSLCTCQCHKPSSPINNEFNLFEQALKQTRLEQQQERSLNNNRLIQTLKRQHDELISIYQQNKIQKQTNINKIDREQQTNKLHLQDSQIQTDLITHNHMKISPKQEQKPHILSTMNSTNNGLVSATRNYSGIFNTIQTSSSSSSSSTTLNSSSQQTTPRLSANAIATTTVTSKTSTITTKTAILTNSHSSTITTTNPPSTSSTASSSHDVVDLTEEDEDDNTNRTPIQRTAPSRQSTSSIHPPTSSATATTTTATAATAATRIRPTNRIIRPNNPVTNGQAFPLRPLPEHVPCDHTIARPQLSITQENATVRLTWNLQSTLMESIQNYEIYAYKQNATVTTSDWKKIGTVKSMRLPMAVTLKEFQSNSHYAFAVRAVSIHNNIGPFCEPKTIFTGNTPVQPLHTSQLLNVST